MGRLEKRIFRLNDEIALVRRQAEVTAEELNVHRHLNDDAQRDAAVSDVPFDRADARETAGDVDRFVVVLEALDRRVARLEMKRDKLVSRLR